MRKTVSIVCWLEIGFAVLCGVARAADSAVNRYAWVELGPGSRLIARLIIESPDRDCPKIEEKFRDGGTKKISMLLRAGAGENFPIRVCEAELSQNAVSAGVEGHRLPLLAKAPAKIAVLGDTGCRMKGGQIQACNDPERWPLAEIALSIAKWKPDLVIHVGDYHYRETACPAGNVGCEGATPGDRWPSWQEDFFAPSAPLFGSAPLVVVRGNHENCARAGKGWFRFLDPRPLSATCSDRSDAYALEIGDHRLWIVDSADEKNVPSSLQEMRDAPEARLSWILTHRPIRRDAEHAKDLPKGTRLVMAGHLHRFSVDVLDLLPPEIITGNGGALLEPGPRFGDPNIFRDFGFMTLERRSKERWQITERDRRGHPVFSCDFREDPKGGTALQCEKLTRS